MADSVDRVFSHALNTVNKIRTGSEKPPAATRLRLYGLYKQSMEGDVEGIMERPTNNDEASLRAREKWDAWHACSGLSRTEAKRRYITTLIQTMHKYASPSPDARELVSELEFVWDQVKSNVPSSSSSSPIQTHGIPSGLHSSPDERPPPFPTLDRATSGPNDDMAGELKALSPVSQGHEEEVDAEDTADAVEVFVDAPDSQVAEQAPLQADFATSQPDSHDRPPGSEGVSLGPKKSHTSHTSPSRDSRWRGRVETALVKLTAEIAALREQLESRRLFALSKQHKIWSWVIWGIWGVVKHFAIDFALLLIVLIWLRRKQDRRFEMAIRVLLGDAVAEVRRIGGSVQHAVVGKQKQP